METKVCANLVIGNKIQSVNLAYVPKVNEILTFENKDYIVKDVKENWVWKNGQTTTKCCTCVAEEFVRNMVGIMQVKFIRDCCSYAEVEEKLNQFKSSFTLNSDRATANFNKSIEDIDKSIKNLEDTKEALLKTIKNFDAANNKLDNLTVKRLTRGNETMTKKFEKLREQQQ